MPNVQVGKVLRFNFDPEPGNAVTNDMVLERDSGSGWEEETQDIFPPCAEMLADWLGDDVRVRQVIVGDGSGDPDTLTRISETITVVTDLAAPIITTTPVISGTARVGVTLTVTTAAVASGNPAPTIGYQWQRNTGSGFANISGATGTSYVLTGDDLGATIRVVATASNSQGSDAADSNPTATVQADTTPLNFTVVWSVAGTSNWGNAWAYTQAENDLGIALLRRPSIAGNPIGYVTDTASGPTNYILEPNGGQKPRCRDSYWFRGDTNDLRGSTSSAAAAGSIRLVFRGTGAGGTGIDTAEPIINLGVATGTVTNSGSGAPVVVPVNPTAMQGDGLSRLMIVVSRECVSADTAQVAGSLAGFTFLLQSGSDRSRLAVYLADALTSAEYLDASPGTLDLQTAVGNATDWRVDYYEVRVLPAP